MAHLQASLRSQAVQSWRDPAGVLRAVNGQFFSATAPEHFATLFFACYEEGSRRLRYVNCGHLPPLLLRADGTSARLGPTAPGLGLLQAWDGVERQAALAPGDLLLLFTDGVSEAENAAGEEFGEARLLEALRAGAGLPAPALLASILEALEAFAGSGLQDDVTLLVARGL
jgi:sigma-B regulation protein RsbU (phosphoserine phosphatase)